MSFGNEETKAKEGDTGCHISCPERGTRQLWQQQINLQVPTLRDAITQLWKHTGNICEDWTVDMCQTFIKA